MLFFTRILTDNPLEENKVLHHLLSQLFMKHTSELLALLRSFRKPTKIGKDQERNLVFIRLQVPYDGASSIACLRSTVEASSMTKGL